MTRNIIDGTSLGFGYAANCDIDHVSNATTIDLPTDHLTTETITLRQYQRIGGVPIRTTCSGPVAKSYYEDIQDGIKAKPSTPADQHSERTDALYSPQVEAELTS